MANNLTEALRKGYRKGYAAAKQQQVISTQNDNTVKENSVFVKKSEEKERGSDVEVVESGIMSKINDLLNKWDSLPESDYRVTIDIDVLPIRSGGDADFPPQLSIVIPVYNVDKWLGACLKSLQAQTFTAWQAILVDDGSSDLSRIICDNYAKRDKRFQVIHQENKGVSAARNKGLALAKAQWLSFVDPDDLIPEDYYSSMLQFAEQNGLDWVKSDTLLFGSFNNLDLDKVNKLYAYISEKNTVVCRTKEEVKSHFEDLMPVGGWGFICNRATWGETEFPESVNIAEDMLAYMQVLPKVKAAAFLECAKYYYRKRDGSLLAKPMEIERYKQMLKESDRIIDALRAEGNEFTIAAQRTAADMEITNLLRAKNTLRNAKKSSTMYACSQILKETRGKPFIEWMKSQIEIFAKEY